MAFTKLFETCRIGSLELKNRMIMPPCSTNMGKDGFVTERMKNFYSTIARGGVGMIVVEDCIVESNFGRHTFSDIHMDDDKYLPGLTQLANGIKAHGARAAIQVNHGGRRSGRIVNGYLAYTDGKIPVAPSSIPDEVPGYVRPRELTLEEIEDLIIKFAEASLRAKQAGFEAVSLHCSHTWLINQFISPTSNLREDEYGGNFEGRMRFAVRILEETRKRVGPEFPLLCRIGGEEPWEGGLTLEDMKKVAHRLESAGIDAFILSRSLPLVPKTAKSDFIPVVAPMRLPRGCMVYLAEGIKAAVNVPVAAVQRINDPILAEEILQQGRADLIALGRALISDPEFPNKAREGRVEEICTCIACLWCTHTLDDKNSPVVCAVNAEVGREIPLDLGRVEMPKKILVIGGGPAGMEAARVAAIRGHEVHLYERSSQLGGQLLVASKPVGKQEIGELIRYLSAEINRLGVNVKTGVAASAAKIEKLAPDMVIMATGAIPDRPPIPGINQSNVVTAIEVLQGTKETGDKVAVLGAGQVGAETAELLAAQGKDITLVDILDEIATDAPTSVRALLLLSLKEHGVKTVNRAKIEEITPTGVVVNRSGKEMVMAADTFVLALGSKPDRILESAQLRQTVMWVGDSVRPRSILEAVHEGFVAGASV
jgi:2,4-dienoyl-CoA reductase-like NADH-dependent reductase (Old Yellow Enzyme family)/thioredoxin reductase